ncbi:HtaA domain-containing protein [Streptomyces sp. NPDC093252]|uniref:HtaA domain-containing protein n=1 Tax=Streptomyces sp. NPDC093252 TaxID=3154980 RepID=UPI00341ADD6A
MPMRPRRRSTALAAAVATAAALGTTALGLAAAAPAAAAGVPLTGYELTWGIKESYRTYVVGMAAGSFTPSGGAAQAADNGVFTFTDGSGTYDPATHTVDLGFKGALKIASVRHGFETTLSDVRFDSAAGEITADVTSKGVTSDDVPLAEVTVSRTMKDMATTLTQQAADIFGSASYAGAAGDPLTVVEKKPPVTTPPVTTPPVTTPPATTPPATTPPVTTPPATTAPPKPTGTTTPAPTATSATPAPARGDIADGTLTWGVKESFRTYVVDGVAQGDITVSAGARQASGNGVFTFPDATGTYDTAADTLTAEFRGAVNFKGHQEGTEYGLDLTLTDLRATLDGGSGELTADVTSLGERSEDVVLAELTAKSADLTARDDVITLDDIAAELTAEGAEAFGDFYEAGSALDPVDLSVALTEGAELPGGDGGTDGGGTDGGTDGGTSGGTGTTGGTTSGGVTGGLANTGSDTPVAALGTAAALTLMAGTGVVLAMRKRRTQA